MQKPFVTFLLHSNTFEIKVKRKRKKTVGISTLHRYVSSLASAMGASRSLYSLYRVLSAPIP